MNQVCSKVPNGAHDLWLEVAERKFVGAFQPLKDTFIEIIKEALSRSVQSSLEQPVDNSVLLNENKILRMKCKKLESDCKRYANEYNTKLQTWADNFQTLKKRYRHLRHKLKENSSEMTNSFNKPLNRSIVDSKTKDDIMDDEIIILNCIEDVKSKKIKSSQHGSDNMKPYLKLSPAKQVKEVDNEKSNEFYKICSSGNDANYNHNKDEIDSKESTNLSDLEDQRNNIRGAETNENCHLNTEQKRSNTTDLEFLKCKRRNNVTYRNNDGSSPKKKETASIAGLKAGGQSLQKSKRFDAHEFDKQTIEPSSKQRRLISPKTQKSLTGNKHIEADNIQLHDSLSVSWKKDKFFGIPALASTPVMKVGQEHCHSIKDFDETVWSAPESPSVVSSFSSPCKEVRETKDEKIFKLPAGFRTKRMQREYDHGMKSSSLLKNIQMLNAESSRDFTWQSKKDDWKNMTSVADLSDDMFEKESTRSSPEQNGTDFKQISKGKHLDDDETCFEKHDLSKENYRYENAAVKSSIPKNEGKFKYNEVVRKRRDRDKLDGFECAECAKWYEGDQDKVEHLKHVCRHKALSSPPPATPRDFWSLGFPDTQEYIDKGYMLDENCSIPAHAQPKAKRDKETKH